MPILFSRYRDALPAWTFSAGDFEAGAPRRLRIRVRGSALRSAVPAVHAAGLQVGGPRAGSVWAAITIDEEPPTLLTNRIE